MESEAPSVRATTRQDRPGSNIRPKPFVNFVRFVVRYSSLLLRGLKAFRFFLRPIRQLLPFGIGQPRRLVHSRIAGQGHAPIAYGIANPIPLFAFLLGIAVRPFRKIQRLSRIVDVAVQPPGNRCNISIPWPTRFVGVTIVTRVPKHPRDFRRRRVRAVHIMSGYDRWGCATKVRQLHESEHANHYPPCPFPTFIHSHEMQRIEECFHKSNDREAKDFIPKKESSLKL